MNETNITPRQGFVLNIVTKSNGLLRGEIQVELEKAHPVSKPTLVRDLTKLIKKRLIRVEGRGKNTKYFSYSKNPLLRPFDINLYFVQEPDERIDAKKNLDPSVFDNLNDLFSSGEIEKVKKARKSFDKQTKKLTPDIFKKELERFVIELSWKSSKIEGNTYTLLETEELIKRRQESKGKSKEEATMILNHKDAFLEILKSKTGFKKLNLSEINQLHNTLIKGLNVSAGIRRHAVGITGTVYRPFDNQFQTKQAMEKLIRVVNENSQPLEKALIIISMIAYIQPYSDGNKRVGRMLANALLLAHDYCPLSYRSIDEQEYKKALILFYEQGSIYHLKRLFIEQLIFASNNYFK